MGDLRVKMLDFLNIKKKFIHNKIANNNSNSKQIDLLQSFEKKKCCL